MIEEIGEVEDEFHMNSTDSIRGAQTSLTFPWLTSRLTPSLVHQGSQSRPTWDILFIWLCFVVCLLSTLYSVDILFDAAWFCEMIDAQTTHLPCSGWHHTCLIVFASHNIDVRSVRHYQVVCVPMLSVLNVTNSETLINHHKPISRLLIAECQCHHHLHKRAARADAVCQLVAHCAWRPCLVSSNVPWGTWGQPAELAQQTYGEHIIT